MKQKNLKLWEILIPKFSNQGLEYSLKYHQEWDKKVRQMAGGLTIMKTAKGHWINPSGNLFVEEMIPVRVSCAEQDIDSVIQKTINHYDQEAILAYELSSNVKLRYKEDYENDI